MSAVKDVKELDSVRKTFVVSMTAGRDIYYFDYDPKTNVVSQITFVRDEGGKEVTVRLLNWELQAIIAIFERLGYKLAKNGGENQT